MSTFVVNQKAMAEIISLVKDTEKFEEIPGVKKLKGYHDAYRIRSGNYRTGVFVDG